ncbi:MAG: hypothetical protein ABSD31_01255 [Candidatus Binataceae bacterium]|jgi:hypothetical protein
MPEPFQVPHIVNLRRLAEIYGVSFKTVKLWLRQGRLNADRGLLRLPGGSWRVDLQVFQGSLRNFNVAQLALPLQGHARLRLLANSKRKES